MNTCSPFARPVSTSASITFCLRALTINLVPLQSPALVFKFLKSITIAPTYSVLLTGPRTMILGLLLPKPLELIPDRSIRHLIPKPTTSARLHKGRPSSGTAQTYRIPPQTLPTPQPNPAP